MIWFLLITGVLLAAGERNVLAALAFYGCQVLCWNSVDADAHWLLGVGYAVLGAVTTLCCLACLVREILE